MGEKLIVEYEEKLRRAMLASCIEILNELIDGDLLFANHLG